MENPSNLVAERFQYILDHRLFLKPMNNFDSVIWYTVSTRCESDINGFESIFEQLHTREQLIELELSLRIIKEDELANNFEQIRNILETNNFWSNNLYCIDKLPGDAQKEFYQLNKSISQNNQMWDLDAKIISILGNK